MSLITPDFGLLFWMVVIFGFLFFLLAKFGFPMITGMVDKRAERITESIRKADEAEAMLATLQEQQNRILDETRLEKSRILKEATETKETIISQAKAQAGEESAKILAHTKLEIAAERENAIREIRKEVAALSVEVAQKIVRKDLDKSENQLSLIDRMVEETAKTQVNS